MKWQKGWKKCRKEERDVFNVSVCEWEEAARLAAEGGYDYFTTTLTISPLKMHKNK